MPSKRSESESEVWACFAIYDSLFWGGNPGDQLVSVRASLAPLSADWRLVQVALIGASDVAELHRRDSDAQLWLTFDYREGSATEGTWGFRYRGPDEGQRKAGYMTPAQAIAAFQECGCD